MLPFAVRTGLEPATPGVTGRYSNQLNYRTKFQLKVVLFSKGMQRYNLLRYVLHPVDNYFCFFSGNRRESSEGLSVSFDDFLKHGLRSYPDASFVVHRLIYDDILEGFRMLRYVKDTIDVALEMSVIFSCHGNKVTKIVRLSIHIEAGPLHKN